MVLDTRADYEAIYVYTHKVLKRPIMSQNKFIRYNANYSCSETKSVYYVPGNGQNYKKKRCTSCKNLGTRTHTLLRSVNDSPGIYEFIIRREIFERQSVAKANKNETIEKNLQKYLNRLCRVRLVALFY